jgi:hypothetical protein
MTDAGCATVVRLWTEELKQRVPVKQAGQVPTLAIVYESEGARSARLSGPNEARPQLIVLAAE